MWTFILGFIFGVIFVIIVGFVILFDVFGKKVPPASFIDQFQPLRIPSELKVFLRSHTEGNFEWESCLSISFLLHFLFQEHKDTRKFRRWVYKKLQLELNDVTTKYAASRIITGVQIRELSLGTESPVIKNIRVEKLQMSDDHELFDEISFEVDVDYRGGFETSVDLSMIFGRSAHLSIKVMKLAGKARIVISRRPYAHWYFAFIDMPQLDFKIDSKFQGHQLKKVIPLITTAFRKAFQRKHVWPNYKIRYRPILPHPFLQPAPPISSFDHIKLNGTGLEVTVLQCTRLNTKIFCSNHTDVYCIVTLDQRPFLTNARIDSTHCISVMLTFTRKGASDPVGLSFARFDTGLKAVKVSDVEVDSTAEKCGFKSGDVLLAINNVPIRNEKQAMRLLSGTAGDLLVLVERDLNYYFEDEIDDQASGGDAFSEEFICISKNNDGTRRAIARRESDTSLSLLVDSCTQTEEELEERKTSTESNRNNYEIFEANDATKAENVRFLRAKSTHIPKLSLQRPSTDIIRSRSDSDLFLELTNSAALRADDSADHCTVDEEEEDMSIENKTSANNLIPKSVSSIGELYSESRENVASVQCEAQSETSGVDIVQERAISKQTRANSPKPSSKRERIQWRRRTKTERSNDEINDFDNKRKLKARASEMALKIHAGRTKFNDLWNRTKRDELPSPTGSSSARSSMLLFGAAGSEAAECALEADTHTVTIFSNSDNTLRENKARVGSPGSSSLEMRVLDKTKKKWIGRKRKSPSSTNRNEEDSTCKAQPLNDPPNSANTDNFEDESKHYQQPLITSRQTKSVPLTKNPLWGQSLHFGLEHRSTKYLNVTIHSRRKFVSSTNPKHDPTSGESSETVEALLGYTSIYIPQIVADCQLTLSNSHREVFHLRAPSSENGDIPSEFSELSRRTGFDARLCYGDVTLGFRFFPNGLPDSNVRAMPASATCSRQRTINTASTNSRHEAVLEPINAAVSPLQSSTMEEDVDDDFALDSERASRSVPESPKQLYPHKWTQFHLRHVSSIFCGICHGKIWLKSASRCSVCNFICHNKCVEKANNHEECVPSFNNFDDNGCFVVLDEKDLVSPSDTTSIAPSSVSSDGSSGTRRRRIATTVTEKLSSTWKNVGAVAAASRRKATSAVSENIPSSLSAANQQQISLSFNKNSTNDDSIPSSSMAEWQIRNDVNSNLTPDITTIDKIIDSKFLSSLSGSTNLRNLPFEPGNAYNSQIIGDTKASGQNVFSDISDISERKSRINEQIDLIQNEIDQINRMRRRLISTAPPDEDSSNAGNDIESGARRRHSLSLNNIDAMEIERLDVKREALALLMLYYCSGLSDCQDKEEQLNSIPFYENMDKKNITTNLHSHDDASSSISMELDDDKSDGTRSVSDIQLHGPEHKI